MQLKATFLRQAKIKKNLTKINQTQLHTYHLYLFNEIDCYDRAKILNKKGRIVNTKFGTIQRNSNADHCSTPFFSALKRSRTVAHGSTICLGCLVRRPTIGPAMHLVPSLAHSHSLNPSPSAPLPAPTLQIERQANTDLSLSLFVSLALSSSLLGVRPCFFLASTALDKRSAATPILPSARSAPCPYALGQECLKLQTSHV